MTGWGGKRKGSGAKPGTSGGPQPGAGRPAESVRLKVGDVISIDGQEYRVVEIRSNSIIAVGPDEVVIERKIPHAFTVGELYNPDIRSWPELGQYSFRGGQHELAVFYSRPTSAEVKAFRSGDAEFALYAQEEQIVLLYKFGTQEWSDAPYTWHRVKPEEQDPPQDLGESLRPLLQIFLVDASTGILRVMRLISLSHEFGQALHAAIQRQIELPFSDAEYDRNRGRLFARYSSAELAKLSQIHFESKR